MSRIGKSPIEIPSGVTVTIDGHTVTVKGPKGELSHTLTDSIEVAQEGNTLLVTRADEERKSRALHGLNRSLINNLIVGVTQGYTTKMEIHGVGYRVQAKGRDLEFALGFSHPVPIEAPAGIDFAVESPTKFSISGIDKQQVGQIAANIRRLRRPDPYKGKGIRYEGEHIRRKVGKTGK